MSATECGAACLAMVLCAHGRHTSIRECREHLGIGRDGATGLQLVQYAREMGMRTRAVSVDLPDLTQLALPAILYWKFSHYVVLERWNERRATVVDPASGRRMLSREELSEGFTGVAFEFVPGEGFQRRRRRDRFMSLRFARGLVGGSRVLLAQVLAVSLLLQLLMAVLPLATRFTVDVVVGQGQADILGVFGLGIVVLLLNQAAATFVRGTALNYVRARIDTKVMTRFFEHLLKLPYRYFQLRTSGDLLMRLSSNSTIRDIVTSQTLSLVIDGLLVCVYLTLLMVVTPLYGWTTLILGIVQIVFVVATFRLVRERSHADIGAQAETQSYAVELLTGVEAVKSMGAEMQALRRWSGLFGVQQVVSLRRQQLDTVFEAFIAVLRVGAPLLMLWLGAREVLGGRMTVGTMLALNSMSLALLTPMMALINATRQLQTVATHLDMIFDVLQEKVEQPGEGVLPTPAISGEVTLSGISVRYNATGPLVLDGIDLHIVAGWKVALVGRTGSGKSTLARTILGLHLPARGQVSYDGHAVEEVDLQALRRQCGVVTQEPALFAGSIRDNISFGRTDLTYEEIELAAQRAMIYDEIMAMPMKFETVLGEGGAGLSGGQQQRVALARALVHKPSLLLLDEATSHLDAVTESMVDGVLSTLPCTRIVIAHRLSTVINADLIVVLDQGCVVETGTHGELIALGGFYESLVRQQMDSPRRLV